MVAIYQLRNNNAEPHHAARPQLVTTPFINLKVRNVLVSNTAPSPTNLGLGGFSSFDQ
jgi:hypothetical protein